MNEKARNLIIRTVSGIVLTAIVLAAVTISRWGLAALTGAITLGGILELYAMARKAGCSPQRITGAAAGLLSLGSIIALCEGVTGASAAIPAGLLAAGCAVVALLASFFIELSRKTATPILNIAVTHMATLYVALPMSMLYMIPYVSDVSADGWNPEPALAYIFIVWANDVFAYLTGMSIGRHRLCERLSPKKSWEGFFGGVAGAVIVAAAAAWYMDADMGLWCGIGLVVALTGVCGDLVESMFKRSAGVKDSGNIIPGHGGFLDRFDAMLLSAPFVFIIFIIYALL